MNLKTIYQTQNDRRTITGKHHWTRGFIERRPQALRRVLFTNDAYGLWTVQRGRRPADGLDDRVVILVAPSALKLHCIIS